MESQRLGSRDGLLAFCYLALKNISRGGRSGVAGYFELVRVS